MVYHPIQRANLLYYNTARLLLSIVLFFALIVLYLGWPSPPQALAQQAQGDVAYVDITGSAQPPGFAPSLVTVHIYDTVVFLNQSQPAVPYAVVAGDGSFSSPAIAPGQQWSLTVNSPGAFEYHGADSTPRMVGIIVAVDGATSLLPTPIPAAQATAISVNVFAFRPIVSASKYGSFSVVAACTGGCSVSRRRCMRRLASSDGRGGILCRSWGTGRGSEWGGASGERARV